MTRMFMIAAVALTPSLGLTADWYKTGPNGGTVTGSGNCTHGNATLTCSRTGVVTGARGVVLGRTGLRVTDRAGTVKTLTTTGANGHGVTTVRTRKR